MRNIRTIRRASGIGGARRFTRVFIGSGLVAVALYGCSSSEEQKRASELAGTCSINTDCKDKLICAFGHCHFACRNDFDCDPGLRCVHGDSGDEGEVVCQLPEELECKVDKDCPGDQACGIDDECRDSCDADEDCTATQLCAKSGECASTDPEHDHVDPDGNIIVDGKGGSAGASGSGGKGGSAGASGSGGGGRGGSGGAQGGSSTSGGKAGEAGAGGDDAAGRGGTVSAGGSTGEGAAAGDSGEGGDAGATGGTAGFGGTSGVGGTAGLGGAGMAGLGSGGTTAGTSGAGGGSGAGQGGMSGSSGAAGSAGTAGAGGGTVEDLTETPDGIEVVENNDVGHAVPLRTSATIHLGGSDHDWFVVTPPYDGKSHIVSFRLEQEAALTTDLVVQSAADNSVIGHPHFSAGVTSFGYLTAGPNTTLHFDFDRYPEAGSAGMLHIELDIVAENDEHEPNDDSDTPALISVGETVYGQLWNPWANAIDDLSEDWFEVDLTQGTAYFTFLQVPEEPRISIRRTTPTGVTSTIYTTQANEAVQNEEFSVPETGRWRISLRPYAGAVDSFVTGAKPTYMSEQYAFKITQ